MKLQEILSDIHALEEELLSFERKYGVRSETFYAAYHNGEEPEDERWVLDFGEWASVYKTWLKRRGGDGDGHCELRHGGGNQGHHRQEKAFMIPFGSSIAFMRFIKSR